MVEKFPTYQQANNNKIELLCINISSPKRGRVTIVEEYVSEMIDEVEYSDVPQSNDEEEIQEELKTDFNTEL